MKRQADKSETTAARQAAGRGRPALPNTEAAKIQIKDVRAAAWNVHGGERDDAELAGLAHSMRETGLVQRITVRRCADGGYEVIDGHRRLAAAKRLGWDAIQADIVDASDEEAQLMTATANVQRVANDPLLEADLIGRLRDAGLSFEEIGAAIGRDERYAARRARLANLTDKWRGWFKERGRGAEDAKMMEHVAAHEQSFQDAVFAEYAGYNDDAGFCEVEGWFEREMRTLDPDECPFDVKGCASCECNTATHGLLFPEMEDKCGRCQDAECFKTRWNGAVDAEIERLRGKGVEVKAAKDKWSVPRYWSVTPHKERKNTTPFVYDEGGLKKLVWTDASSDVAAQPAKTEEELAEERRVKAARSRWLKLRRSAFDKARAALKSDDAERFASLLVSSDGFADEMRRKYADMLGGWIPDEEARLFVRVCGAGTFGIDEDEADALEAEDPAEVAARKEVAE